MVVPRETMSITAMMLPIWLTPASLKMVEGRPDQKAARRTAAITNVVDSTALVFWAHISPSA